MRKIVLFFLLGLANFCLAAKLQPAKLEFVHSVVKQTKIINAQIHSERSHLIQLNQKLLNGQPLTSSELEWLKNLAQYYHVKMSAISKKTAWKVLQRRVDVLPVSLVVAQAVYESDWGQSRFAKKAHNYFGIRCYTKGCGMIPKQRPDGATFEVKSFPTMQTAIKNYIHILNIFNHYKKLRYLRSEQRMANESLDGMLLAGGLEGYSQQSYYIKAIRSIINRYQFYQYD